MFLSLWLPAVMNVWKQRIFWFLFRIKTSISTHICNHKPEVMTISASRFVTIGCFPTCLTLSSMIQSKVMNKRSKVTKRQKVLLTSEMHFFSPASYDSTLAQMGLVLIDTTPLPVSRESALLLHRLSITPATPTEQGQPRPLVNRRWTHRWRRRRRVIGAGSQTCLFSGCGLCRSTSSQHLQRGRSKR